MFYQSSIRLLPMAIFMFLAGCSGNESQVKKEQTSTETTASASAAQTQTSGIKVGIDQPRNDTDFWTAFANYVPQKGAELGVDLFQASSTDVAVRCEVHCAGTSRHRSNHQCA